MPAADDTPPETAAAAAEEAVRAFLEHVGTTELSTGRFVIVVETMDAATGGRGVWTATPLDQAEWDSRGLLAFATDQVCDANT